ncbi:hypothetical protein ACI2IP_13480 [Microbacterium sp. NPDC090218]
MTDASSSARRSVPLPPMPWSLLVSATLLAAGTVALICLVAVPVGPVVCAAVYPPTSNCFLGHREGSALVMTVIVLAVYVVTILIAAVFRRSRAVLLVGVVLLAIAPFVSYAVVAWAPGFSIASE